MRIVSPATFSDLAEVMSAGGFANPAHWTYARIQIESGRSWAARGDDGAAVAVAGLVLTAPFVEEAWFAFAPASGRKLAALARAVRLTLAAEAYGRVVVRLTTDEGRRFARLAGFTCSEAGRAEWQGADPA